MTASVSQSTWHQTPTGPLTAIPAAPLPAWPTGLAAHLTEFQRLHCWWCQQPQPRVVDAGLPFCGPGCADAQLVQDDREYGKWVL